MCVLVCLGGEGWLKDNEGKRAVVQSKPTSRSTPTNHTTNRSKTKKAPLLETYAGHLRSVIIEAVDHPSHRERPLEGLKIVVDAGNGSGGFFAEQVCVFVLNIWEGKEGAAFGDGWRAVVCLFVSNHHPWFKNQSAHAAFPQTKPNQKPKHAQRSWRR